MSPVSQWRGRPGQPPTTQGEPPRRRPPRRWLPPSGWLPPIAPRVGRRSGPPTPAPRPWAQMWR